MKRIVYAVLATLSGLVLLFSYRTSLDAVDPMAATEPAASSGTAVSAPATGASDDESQEGDDESESDDADDAGSGSGSGSTSTQSGGSTSSSASGLVDGTYTGASADTRYGPVQVQISVSGGAITDVQVLDYPASNSKDRQINQRALPVLDLRDHADAERADRHGLRRDLHQPGLHHVAAERDRSGAELMSVASSRTAAPHRIVRVEQIMGTAISIHVLSRSDSPARVRRHALSMRASPSCATSIGSSRRIGEDSDIMRLAPRRDRPRGCRPAGRRGRRGVPDSRGRHRRSVLGDVARMVRSHRLREGLGGRDGRAPAPRAARRGRSSPSASTRAATCSSSPLPTADWRWNIGVADPHHPGAVIATLEVTDGAVATSGAAERGHHIIDPRTGAPALGTASATVVADGLAQADLWATAAVVAGFDDRSWIPRSGTRTGIVIADDGRVTRWLDGVTVDVVGASPTF